MKIIPTSKVMAAKFLTGVDWNLRGDVLEQSNDKNPRVSVPSEADIQKVLDDHSYVVKRRREYPSVQDQLDAFWKGGADLEAMRARIQAIREKHPKPENPIL